MSFLSFGRGNTGKTEAVFVDVENELEVIREDSEFLRRFLFTRRNQIFIIDWNDIVTEIEELIVPI